MNNFVISVISIKIIANAQNKLAPTKKKMNVMFLSIRVTRCRWTVFEMIYVKSWWKFADADYPF